MKLNYLSLECLNKKNIPLPDADTIDICIFSIENFSFLKDNIALLSAQEQKKALSLRQEEDRLRFYTSHVLLRRILSLYLLYPAEKLLFAVEEHGKPRLYHEGSSFPKIHFNLSHSGEFAALAFSLASPVGIDIEKVRSGIRAKTLVRRFFHPDELSEFSALDASGQQAFLFRRWTVREAFLKGIGTGLSIPPDSFYVQQLSSMFRIKNGQKDYSFWRIEPVPVPDGYYCSIAYRSFE